VDINTSDTTNIITCEYIYQVISSSDSKIYCLIIRDRITTYLRTKCRYSEDLYKPRVKMRRSIIPHICVGLILAKHVVPSNQETRPHMHKALT
jgi:hypothetical protein